MAKITLADGTVIEGTAEELRELAKAFGEVAEATEKEVPEDFDLRTKDGAEETPQDVREGDYVVSSVSELGITAGKPYKITEGHSDGDFTFRDDDDDLQFWNVEYDDVTIYRPIEGAPQVGDKILVTDAHLTNGKYDNGDILTVKDYYYRNIIGRYVAEVGEDKPYLHREEFEIIERPEATSEETPEAKPEVGSVVKATKDVSDMNDKSYVGWSKGGQGLVRVGTTGEVIEVSGKGVYAKFDEEAAKTSEAYTERFFLANGEYEVIEETPDFPAPETIEAGDIVRNKGKLYEVKAVGEPGFFDADKGVTLSGVSGNGTGWRYAHNCELVAKKSDRKDV